MGAAAARQLPPPDATDRCTPAAHLAAVQLGPSNPCAAAGDNDASLASSAAWCPQLVRSAACCRSSPSNRPRQAAVAPAACQAGHTWLNSHTLSCWVNTAATTGPAGGRKVHGRARLVPPAAAAAAVELLSRPCKGRRRVGRTHLALGAPAAGAAASGPRVAQGTAPTEPSPAGLWWCCPRHHCSSQHPAGGGTGGRAAPLPHPPCTQKERQLPVGA